MAAEQSNDTQIVNSGLELECVLHFRNSHTLTHHFTSVQPTHPNAAVPPAAVTDAERRRFGHAYEELKRRYANLDSLLDAAHSTVSRARVEDTKHDVGGMYCSITAFR